MFVTKIIRSNIKQINKKFCCSFSNEKIYNKTAIIPSSYLLKIDKSFSFIDNINNYNLSHIFNKNKNLMKKLQNLDNEEYYKYSLEDPINWNTFKPHKGYVCVFKNHMFK
jgi:hypothetical protein